MPPGDAQRVWFPEMIEALRKVWSRTTTWEELADFCHRMTALRTEIRSVKGIRPPLMRCPRCGRTSRSNIEGISIRSALFVLWDAGIVTEAEFEELDKGWKKHRHRHGLDRFGGSADPGSGGGGPAGACC